MHDSARVTAAKDRLADATAARVRATHLQDQATARANHIQEQLHTDFGVTNLDEAKALLHTLQTDLDTTLTALNTALDTAGP